MSQSDVTGLDTQNTLIGTLGIEFTHADKEKMVGTMPVGPKTHQPFGILHGGASVALAETLASMGAFLNVDPSQQYVVGLEINANHIRAKSDGVVTGTATPIHRGRTTQVWEIKIQDEQGKLICYSRCTLANVDKK